MFFLNNDNTNWVMDYCFAEIKGKLYFLTVIADESSIGIVGAAAYIGMLNSLIFNLSYAKLL